ncbi:MAG: rhomboid family intramembrane serine protease [Bacteroidales bacterium]|nr:rhomboid family intramembrane serine protease [Bacteroidales bacterium]MCR5115130.1 rhomboid family intramembrane serine protease [Bacteroidales bacterium]
MANPFQSIRGQIHFWWLDVKRFFRSRSVLSNLIIINVAVWLLMLIAHLIVLVPTYLLGHPISLNAIFSDYLAFHTDLHLVLTRPWTIVTSLFVHAGFGHLFFNMLVLYIVGRYFLQYKNDKHLLATYLIGGVCGNLVYLAAYHVFPVFEPMISDSSCIGASGAVMAVMFAVTVYRPNHPINLLIFGQLKLKWLALTFILLDLIGLVGDNAGGHFSHLGGALYGSLAALWFLYANKLNFKKIRKKKKYYSSREAGAARTMTDEDYNAQKRRDEKRIDEILDKISKDGYGALSAEEKDFLYHYRR